MLIIIVINVDAFDLFLLVFLLLEPLLDLVGDGDGEPGGPVPLPPEDVDRLLEINLSFFT